MITSTVVRHTSNKLIRLSLVGLLLQPVFLIGHVAQLSFVSV